jgi:anaerobic magnesium-protoporphyrin IX monomethyl ester cyclase
MKVVLVLPAQTHLDELSDWWYPPVVKRDTKKGIVSLGMLYLCSSVQPRHDAVFIDNSVQRLSDDQLVDWCLKHEPDVVGFGGTFQEWPQASSVAARIKAMSPNTLTVYGGPNATARPEKHVHFFDYVFRGMAERTLDEFLCRIERKEPVHGIDGLCSRTFPEISPPGVFSDLDSLPWPDRTRIDLNQYKRTAPYCPSPADVVVASRGCPFKCRFCSAQYIWGQKYVARSVESVVEEIRYMKETYGSRTIHFREDNFTVNKKKLLEFCSALKQLNVDWLCQSRVGSLDEETVRVMKESGCKLISCGFESINDSTLKFMRKGQTAEQVVRTIETFEKVGIPYTGGFMVATPNEGREEILNTLRFVRKVSQYRYSRIPNMVARFVGMPVSEMYHEVLQNGLVEFNWRDGELLFPRTYQLSIPEVSALLEDFQGGASSLLRWRRAQTALKSRIAACFCGVRNAVKRKSSVRQP